MLILAFIVSLVFTAYCIWAGAHPPTLPAPVQTKTVSPAMAAIVQMIEDGGDDFDDDPPTVVQTKQK